MPSFGQALGQSAYKVARRMGNNKSTGRCALAVGDALSAVVGESIACHYRGNAYQWINKMKASKYWKFYKQSKDTKNLPAGSLVIWDKQPTHPFGHIEVADGNGHLCSDFIRPDSYALYINNPANVIPLIYVPVECEVTTSTKKLPYDTVVCVSTLNVRQRPFINAPIIGELHQNDVVTVWAEEHQSNMVWGKNSLGYFCIENKGVKYVR